MPDEVKVSVILPVYNVAAYLKHSLSCLLNQTLREIEVICVDDGSTDASVDIIREFMAKDARIRLFRNKHSFAGSARNTGLGHALGEWVMFFDPDDYCDATMLEELYALTQKFRLDVLLCGFYNDFGQRMNYEGPFSKLFVTDFCKGKIFNARDLGNFIWSLIVYPFNKIYRREFLIKNKIRFQTIQNTNDASFAYEVAIAADRMMVHNKAYYYYRHNRKGNTRLTKGEDLSCVIQAYEYSFERCRQYPAFPACEAGFKAVILFSYIWHLKTYGVTGDEKKRFFFDSIKQYIKNHFDNTPAVQEFLKRYSPSYYFIAHLISNHDYKVVCRILQAKRLSGMRISSNAIQFRFLGLTLWKHRYSSDMEVKQILGIPYAQIKFTGGYKKRSIMGIPISVEPSLSDSVLFCLSYIRNRISIRDSQRVCCVFDLSVSWDSNKQRLQEIVQEEASKVHFVVQNATDENLIRRFISSDKIASVLQVSLGAASEKALKEWFFGSRCNFRGVQFINLETKIVNYAVALSEWFQKQTGRRLNLRAPKTFNEKIQWLKLYDSTPIKTRLADKYLVREWVKEKIGEKYLIPLLGVYDQFEDINFEKLPNQFVIKCNHGCGYNIVVRDKSQLDLNDAKQKVDRWMCENFAFKNGFELHYRDIKPKILVEAYLENEGTNDLYDYKFFCFNGKVIYIEFLSERNLSGLKVAFYNRQWEKQDFTSSYPLDTKTIPKPANLELMIQLAEKLSDGFNYVRVDFYLLNNGEVKFGEMTFTPASGTSHWSSQHINLFMGQQIKLPELAYDIDTGEYYKPRKKLMLLDWCRGHRPLKSTESLLKEHILDQLKQARIDIKNVGTEKNAIAIEARNCTITAPSWFCDAQGKGQVLTSVAGKKGIKIFISGGGNLTLNFMGPDIRFEGKRFPVWLDYKSIKIDGKEILSSPIAVWHNKPWRYEMPVRDEQEVWVEYEQQSHPYSREELKETILKLNPTSEAIQKNIDALTDKIYKAISHAK